MTKTNIEHNSKFLAISSKSYIKTCLLATTCSLAVIDPVYADWFAVDKVKENMITPVYKLVDENLGIVAFVMGGFGTYFTRGRDMYEKSIAFGLGSLGTAGAVKLAKTVLHFGAA